MELTLLVRRAIAITVLMLTGFTNAFADGQIYRVVQLRAAPGMLLDVIEVLRSDMRDHEKYGIQKPYLVRHSQGDHWDLMLIFPVRGIADHFSVDSIRRRAASNTLEKEYGDPFFGGISWQQQSFVKGPPVREFDRLFSEFGYYHIEIFTSIAGKQGELLRQRKMENDYLDEIGRRPNLIFTRVSGAPWDIFTIGFYRDIKDYSASADIPDEKKQAAAKKAGFKGLNTIGSYLRELIREHHDTLGGAVRP